MEVCKLFNKFVYFLVRKSIGDIKDVDPFVALKVVAKWGGRVCLGVFFAALLTVTWVVLFAMIPTEWSTSESDLWFFVRLVILVHVYYSVIFHYYKARTLSPVKNPGEVGDRFCIPCNNWKGEFTSHCKGCDKCIYRIDHHCPHIGQCVGAHNQANFFLFIFWLLVGTGLFFILAPGFWWNWVLDHEGEVDTEYCWYPLCFNQFIYIVLRKSNRFLNIPTNGIDSAIKFSAFLFLMLHFILWCFFVSYTYTISCGVTMAMKVFQITDENPRLPFSWRTLKTRWRRYFHCEQGSLWSVFFIPRTRPIVVYKQYRERIL